MAKLTCDACLPMYVMFMSVFYSSILSYIITTSLLLFSCLFFFLCLLEVKKREEVFDMLLDISGAYLA